VPLKIATWNVNGIRARQVQVEEWVAREPPDVLCLQEIKAAPDQIPMTLVEMEGYWCYWHGGKAYSGVGLLVRKARFPDRPSFTHPSFDFETRLVVAHLPALTVASIYVPNGGKDFPAKLKFLEAVDEHARQAHESGQPIVLCGDLNVARTEMDVHPKERKPRAIGQRPEEREILERIISRGLVDLGRALDPDNDQLSPGGRPGATCGSATSAGASTTCSPAPRSQRGPHAARSTARWARAITGRWSPSSSRAFSAGVRSGEISCSVPLTTLFLDAGGVLVTPNWSWSRTPTESSRCFSSVSDWPTAST